MMELPVETEAPPQTPKASIIVPAYNRADVLWRAIESALAQTETSIEVIVVDDASTDETTEVVRGYAADPRLRYIKLDQNTGGPATPRNTGVKSSTAPVIVFLDQDDALRTTYVETIINEFKEQKIGLVWARRAVYDLHGTLKLVALVDRCRGSSLLPIMLTWTPGTSGLAVRKSVFEELGGLDPSVGGLDDLDFTLRFALANKWNVSIIDKVLLEIYSSPASLGNLVNHRYAVALSNFVKKHRTNLSLYKEIEAQYLYKLARVYSFLGDLHDAESYLIGAIRKHPLNVKYIMFFLLHKFGLDGLFWSLASGLRWKLLHWRRRILMKEEESRSS